MTSSSRMRVSLLGVLVATVAFSATTSNGDDTIVKFGPATLSETPTPQGEMRRQAYMKLPAATREHLESAMVVGESLGLSSTGRVELIGVYHRLATEDRKPNELVYHFIQRDLGGNRLFWSILYDNQDRTVRVLYQINRKTDSNFKLPQDAGYHCVNQSGGSRRI